MTIGETVPAHKRREQQRAREETQRYLDAGGKITYLPYGASAETHKANQAQRKPSRGATDARKVLDVMKRLGEISYVELANELCWTRDKASTKLRDLAKTGYIEPAGETGAISPKGHRAKIYRAR